MNQALKPIISIAIPTYEMKGHGAFFLERCLGSIQKQNGINFENIEIVVSDQSHDGSVKQLCQSHPLQPRYQHTKRGCGKEAAFNLNQALSLARGDYIKILFQDDFLVEGDYLLNLHKVIEEQHPQCIISSAVHSKDGKNLFNSITPMTNPYFLFGNNTISSPSVLTLESSIAKNMLFDENLQMLFDCEFYYRMFECCQSISAIDSIHIANGIWEGQSQHHIDTKQFTKEMRYLNWKHPQAQLVAHLPEYKKVFFQLHPNASLPFSENIRVGLIDQILFDLNSKMQRWP
jgi:glycosyltransferase involved in cell wall biosynthesis